MLGTEEKGKEGSGREIGKGGVKKGRKGRRVERGNKREGRVRGTEKKDQQVVKICWEGKRRNGMGKEANDGEGIEKGK